MIKLQPGRGRGASFETQASPAPQDEDEAFEPAQKTAREKA